MQGEHARYDILHGKLSLNRDRLLEGYDKAVLIVDGVFVMSTNDHETLNCF